MKIALIVLALAGMAVAQTPGDILRDKLAADLQPLASVSAGYDAAPSIPPTAPAGEIAWQRWVQEKKPEQQRVIEMLLRDVTDCYHRPILKWDFALVLTSSLAGNDRSSDSLRSLASSLIAVFDAALYCRRFAGCQLNRFDDLQLAPPGLVQSLKAAGVNKGRMEAVLERLYESLVSIEFGLMPIPPATRPTGLSLF
jgi:hypothetical protein